MSRKPENTFISSVHRYFPNKETPYRMKNHNEYVAGVADVWYSGKRADLWIEYKFLVIPKRATTVIDLTGGADPPITALQQLWLRDRATEGRNVGVIVGSKDGGVWFPGQSWENPLTASMFLSRLVSRQELAGIILRLCAA